MDIDAEIAAGVAASAEAQPKADAPKATEVAKAPEETLPEAPAEPTEPTDVKDEPFPKKAINALSRRDKQIGKLKAQLEQMQSEMQKFREQPPKAQPQGDGRPKEGEYQSFAEYLEALSEWKADQKISKALAERDTKQQSDTQAMQEQRWVAEREQAVAVKAQEFAKENPEVIALVEEYGDVIDELPPQIQRAFLEADNAPLAFYNLAKEGKLEALASMSPARAAMEIGRAQTQAFIKPKTKAPLPLPAARGSVAAEKSLDEMSQDELLKWVKS